jgi:DNA-binding transcriptional LysR family regulator
MDIKGLRYFIAAAERLNFTTAAKECYVTQTAMSLHINKMETELGFKLFDRGKRSVELTSAGIDFLHQARTIVEDYSIAVAHSMDVAVGVTGSLNVLLPSCIEGFVFMDNFREFIKEYPEVQLNLKVDKPSSLVNNLRRRRTDVVIAPPYDMDIDPEIDTIHMRYDSPIVICSKDHPLADPSLRLTSDMLSDETVALTVSTATPATFRSLGDKWRTAGIKLHEVMEVSNMDEMIMCIDLNRAIGIVPAFVGQHLDALSHGLAFRDDIIFENDPPILETSAGFLKDNLNPVLQNFLKFCKPTD